MTWVASGLIENAIPIAAMNAILLLINAWGVWQYLLSPKSRKKIEKLERLEQEAEEQVEAEESEEPSPA